MTDLASPIVQVVTTGTDWPAIVAAISGGVVGLAGIIFAWHQSGRTISAEDARAKLAEKRRIYANCLVALTAFADAKAKAVRGTALPPAQRVGLLEEASRAQPAATNAAFEVDLIGPIKLASMTNSTFQTLFDADPLTQGGDIGMAVGKLTAVMGLDLGEHDEMPEVPSFLLS